MALLSKIKAVLQLDNKDFKKGLKESEKQTQGFGKQMQKMGGIIAGAFAVKVVADFAKAALKAYDIQIQAETKLLTALKGRTDVQERLIKQAGQLQLVTLFGDEATIEAQAMLASLGLNEKAIIRLIPLVQDLATKANMGLVQAADLVAKSVGSSTNALSRYGVVIEGSVGSVERLDSAVMSLNEQVGGQAAASALVGLGPLKQLQNAWGDLLEKLGEYLLDPAFIDGMKTLTNFLQGKDFDWASIPKAWLAAYKKFVPAGILWTQFYEDMVDSLVEDTERWEKTMTDLGPFWQRVYGALPEIPYAPLGGTGVGSGDGGDALPDKANVTLISEDDLIKTKEFANILAATDGEVKSFYDTITDTDAVKEFTNILAASSDLVASFSEPFDTEAIEENLSDVVAIYTEFGQAMSNIASSAIQGAMNVLADALEGKDVLKSFGSYIGSLGRMMMAYGAMMIAKSVLETIAMTPGPQAIAAGAALVAVGAAAVAMSGAIGRTVSTGGGAGGYSGGGGYGSYGGGTFGSGGGYTSQREIVLVARGNDLVAVLNAQDYEDNMINP